MAQSHFVSLADLHQRLDALSQSLAAAAAPAMGRFNDMSGLSIPPAMGQAETAVQQQDPSPTPASGPETGNADFGSVAEPAAMAGNLATRRVARFESLEGLYRRIAASAASSGSDGQANKASTETACNLALILQALETQNRLLENAKSQQSQQILWQ
jgi:hypothetical protein